MTEKVHPLKGKRPPNAGNAIRTRKGIPNKTTRILKDAIIQAAINAGGDEGLVGYLQKQASEYPKGFLPLLGKVLPMQLAGEDGGPLQIIVKKPGA